MVVVSGMQTDDGKTAAVMVMVAAFGRCWESCGGDGCSSWQTDDGKAVVVMVMVAAFGSFWQTDDGKAVAVMVMDAAFGSFYMGIYEKLGLVLVSEWWWLATDDGKAVAVMVMVAAFGRVSMENWGWRWFVHGGGWWYANRRWEAVAVMVAAFGWLFLVFTGVSMLNGGWCWLVNGGMQTDDGKAVAVMDVAFGRKMVVVGGMQTDDGKAVAVMVAAFGRSLMVFILEGSKLELEGRIVLLHTLEDLLGKRTTSNSFPGVMELFCGDSTRFLDLSTSESLIETLSLDVPKNIPELKVGIVEILCIWFVPTAEVYFVDSNCCKTTSMNSEWALCLIGYAIELDMTSREIQAFAKVDGEIQQKGSTEDMIFKIPYLISHITTFGCSLAKHRTSNTLEAKDILLHLVSSDINKERLAADWDGKGYGAQEEEYDINAKMEK
ncbi:hypothetical protein RHMOL_Rhmol06G0138800 [Rhododendron molle]|uniref:Uncharacterized protein n=1 Tax=Rhododendron molle TaxID=49168 RepID=A0ACC0NBY0_RHOML|nr:hypothetical protein RHMOL_Rhmol06G0138800 [Rhododendron molle]